jgi:hypothetical protein
VEHAFVSGYSVAMLIGAAWAFIAAACAYFLLPDDRPKPAKSPPGG